jgi:hypothetical protein
MEREEEDSKDFSWVEPVNKIPGKPQHLERGTVMKALLTQD